jgi:precorrin-6B methylase 2
MEKNITYKTGEIVRYFAENRVRWEQFYDSEKLIIQGLGITSNNSILDIGCGCGGLGIVLKEKFGTTNYTGIEINELAAHKARTMNPSATVLCGDFLDFTKSYISEKVFDTVFSLSCFDWNIQFDEMLLAAWTHVAQGGSLIATFRIVATEGCGDMNKSYQYINYDGKLVGEKAAYIVLNAKELFDKLVALSPSSITAYGYFGAPSRTAVTPFKNICFTAVSITKWQGSKIGEPRLDLQLPNEILLQLDS